MAWLVGLRVFLVGKTPGETGENTVAALFNLKAAVEREKAVQAIGVHRECKNCVVTFWVMSQWFHFLGASRGCADFRDPTTVFRLMKQGRNVGEIPLKLIRFCTDGKGGYET